MSIIKSSLQWTNEYDSIQYGMKALLVLLVIHEVIEARQSRKISYVSGKTWDKLKAQATNAFGFRTRGCAHGKYRGNLHASLLATKVRILKASQSFWFQFSRHRAARTVFGVKISCGEMEQHPNVHGPVLGHYGCPQHAFNYGILRSGGIPTALRNYSLGRRMASLGAVCIIQTPLMEFGKQCETE